MENGYDEEEKSCQGKDGNGGGQSQALVGPSDLKYINGRPADSCCKS